MGQEHSKTEISKTSRKKKQNDSIDSCIIQENSKSYTEADSNISTPIQTNRGLNGHQKFYEEVSFTRLNKESSKSQLKIPSYDSSTRLDSIPCLKVQAGYADCTLIDDSSSKPINAIGHLNLENTNHCSTVGDVNVITVIDNVVTNEYVTNSHPGKSFLKSCENFNKTESTHSVSHHKNQTHQESCIYVQQTKSLFSAPAEPLIPVSSQQEVSLKTSQVKSKLVFDGKDFWSHLEEGTDLEKNTKSNSKTVDQEPLPPIVVSFENNFSTPQEICDGIKSTSEKKHKSSEEDKLKTPDGQSCQERLMVRKSKKEISKVSKVRIKNNLRNTAIPKSLKRVEKIAASVNGSICDKSFQKPILSAKPSNEVHNIPSNTFQGSLSLEECTLQMNQFGKGNSDNESSLEQTVLNKLKDINTFITNLKSCPVLNKTVFHEVENLKSNILSLLSEGYFINVDLKNNMNNNGSSQVITVADGINKHILEGMLVDQPEVMGNLVGCCKLSNLAAKEEISESSIKVIKNCSGENGNEIKIFPRHASPLSSSSSSSTNSPEKVTSENSKPPCTTSCPKTAILTEREQSKITVLQSNKDNLSTKHSLTTYEKVLDIVYESHKRSLEINVSLYICINCDYVGNSKEEIQVHLSDEGHLAKDTEENWKWNFCSSCCVNLFATDEQFEEHCLSELHSSIEKMINESKKAQITTNVKPDQKTPVVVSDEIDNKSECSSSSVLSLKSPKTPHEMLLKIVRDIKKQNPRSKETIGVYCQVCNKYSIYSKINNCNFEKHAAFKDDIEVYTCEACQVDIKGTEKVWREHVKLQLHAEMCSENENDSLESDPEETTSLPEGVISDPNGAHHTLMKLIVKKHLNKEPRKTAFGFYCYLCNAYSLDKKEWTCHLNTASHSFRINSTDCINKDMFFKCDVCSVEMVCDQNIFLLHNELQAHKAIANFYDPEQNSSQQGIPETVVIESESSDDNLVETESDISSVRQKKSTSDLNQRSENEEKKNVYQVRKGISVTGLPQNVTYRELRDYFKKYGYVKTCTLNGNGGGTVTFDSDAAKRLLQSNEKHYIRKNEVKIQPLYVEKTPELVTLSLEVSTTLETLDSFQKCMSGLQSQLCQQTKQRTRRRNSIKQDLSVLLPRSKIHFFGSQTTGLATLTSDFDIYVDIDSESFYRDMKRNEQLFHLQRLEQCLRNSHFSVKETLYDARVPIIRVLHKKTNSPCDISFRNGLSVENSNLIKLYVDSDTRVGWMIIVIKWWMRANQLLNSKVFTSYGTTWMVLYYLMRIPEPLICPIVRLRKNCMGPYNIAFWDCRFTRELSNCFQTVNHQSLVELLIGFFNFYKDFEFKPVVMSPLIGDEVPRRHFDSLNLPRVFSNYVAMARKLERIPYRDLFNENAEYLRTNTPICLQDPFDLSHNITKGVNSQQLRKFQEVCRLSSELCSKWGK